MSDIGRNSYGREAAKLKKRNDGSYSWREWYVYQAKHVSDHKLCGKTGYYAEQGTYGVWFTGANLAYMRAHLVEYEAALSKEADEVPKGCHKTPERKEAEREARTPSERLEDAHVEVLHILEGMAREAMREQQQFIDKLTVDSIAHAISWGFDAVTYSFVNKVVQALLDTERTPRKHLPQAIIGARRNEAYMMVNDYYRGDSTGAFHRATEAAKRSAAKHIIKMLDSCIRVYKREGVEIDEDYLV